MACTWMLSALQVDHHHQQHQDDFLIISMIIIKVTDASCCFTVCPVSIPSPVSNMESFLATFANETLWLH